ncbi:DUF4188 domain-containing protein [Haloarchaeobius amylolyticus]|uniref:DUF4188 domain-containing protein n=1 Tax=Haloarchaeobius amylolyticus TaxID=1198296 RepID=UPI002271C761
MPVDERRLTAEYDGDLVVFLIGMRVNALWRVHEWLPVFLAMPRMLRELEADPESGLLAYRTLLSWRSVTMVQYWDAFDSLEEYARDDEQAHRPAWADYTQQAGASGSVGIWHETYCVREGEHESVYHNMPAIGLREAGERRPATGSRKRAASRLGNTGPTGEETGAD